MATYYYVCATEKEYKKGFRFRSLRTARRGAYRHINHYGGRGWSEIVKETNGVPIWIGEVIGHKSGIIWRPRSNNRMKVKAYPIKARYIKNDGTLGKTWSE